ncbi:hypothetical protein D0859_12644 [Hortaea werneckii]|uniref:Nodulin-like domain-containing protein n=1 Tax=Hortaea werneckii TaxID=91943 RepID=A0A3M7ICR0_HORWE|nr:hypothetical protein D0859_12644 [Hortaea werneckii]
MSRCSISNWPLGQQNELETTQKDGFKSEKPSTQMQSLTGGRKHPTPTSVMNQPLSNPFAVEVPASGSSQTMGSLSTAQWKTYEPGIVESLVPSPLQPGRRRGQQREEELSYPSQRPIIHRPRPTQFASHTVPYRGEGSTQSEINNFPLVTHREAGNSYDLDLEARIPDYPRPPPQVLQTATSKPSLLPTTLSCPSDPLRSPLAVEGWRLPNKALKTLGVVERPPRQKPVPNPTFLFKPSITPSSSTTSSTNLADRHPKPLPLPPRDPTQPPQNGRTAWHHALTGMLVIFNCWGLANAFGLFEAYYTTYYLPSSSPSAVAWRLRYDDADFGWGGGGNDDTSESGVPDATSDAQVFTGLSSSYLLAAAGMFLTFLGVYFGYFMMVTFASTELKMSNTAATNLLIFMLAANLPGRFLPAVISDKCIGPLNTIIPSIFLSAAVIGLWIASGEPNKAAMIVIACFYGFVSAGIQVLYAPAVYAFCLEPTRRAHRSSSSSCVERQPTQMVTDRLGLKAGGIFTCVGLACLIGTPIGGALISYRANRGMAHTYLWAQIFTTEAKIVSKSSFADDGLALIIGMPV